jgi:hypothetical protein
MVTSWRERLPDGDGAEAEHSIGRASISSVASTCGQADFSDVISPHREICLTNTTADGMSLTVSSFSPEKVPEIFSVSDPDTIAAIQMRKRFPGDRHLTGTVPS